MNDLANSLKQPFHDKEYRHGYVDEFLNTSIATQIKVLREQHGWSQQELAEHAGMLQPRISVMENINYSSWSIKILRKIAEAFDLTLRVSFESFGTRVKDIEEFSRKALERSSFKDDHFFKGQKEQKEDVLNEANRTLTVPDQPILTVGYIYDIKREKEPSPQELYVHQQKAETSMREVAQ